MKILIDGDACPVKKEIIELAGKYQLAVIIVSSIAHYSFNAYPDFVQMVYVEKGHDQADFKIVQLTQAGDLIVTQDYGLAALLLPKNCYVIHHHSYEYTQENINSLLQSRHIHALQRHSGQRTKGPKAFTQKDRQKFKVFLETFLKQKL